MNSTVAVIEEVKYGNVEVDTIELQQGGFILSLYQHSDTSSTADVIIVRDVSSVEALIGALRIAKHRMQGDA